MKKIGIMFIMMFLLLGTMSFISAEELTIPNSTEIPGTFSYGFNRAMDNFKLSFTFNKERKAERAMDFAEERLSEYERFTLENQTKRSEKALLAYNRYIEKSEKAINKTNFNSNATAGYITADKIQDRINSHKEKLDEIYTRILEKRGNNMTNEQLLKLDEVFNKLKEKSDTIEKKAAERKNNFKIKHKVLSEMNDSEMKAFEDKIDFEEGITQNRLDREEREKNRFNRSVIVRSRNLDRIKTLLENANLTDEQKAKIQQRIDSQESHFEDFKIRRNELVNKLNSKKDERNLRNHTSERFDDNRINLSKRNFKK